MTKAPNPHRSKVQEPLYVSYVRVSTERQGQSGLGLEAQQRAIAAFVTGKGRLVGEFVEVESGKTAANRPQLLDAIKRCRLQGATLLVAKLDRLSRDLWFIATIRKFGVKFICADNPEINELTIHILGALAQYERQLISERTKAALAAARERGVKLGNPRIRAVRNTNTDSAHAKIQRNADDFAREVLPEIEKLIQEGAKTLLSIAEGLNSSDITTRRKTKWTPTAVRRVLKRKPSADPLFDLLSL